MKMSRSVMGHLTSPDCYASVRNPRADRANFLRTEQCLRLGISAAQGAEQPGAGIGPEGIRAAGGDAEDGRGLGNGQPREVAELNQFGRLGIGASQSRKSGV